MSSRPSGSRRADAARNDERIVEAALVVLAEDPGAGMDAIASAAGVGRATLYRRYPTREELLETLRLRAREDIRAAVEASRLTAGTASEALERLVAGIVSATGHYSFLAQNLRPGAPRRDASISAELAKLIRRGQKSGEFSKAAPAEWWVEVLFAVLLATGRSSAAAGLDEEAAVALIVRTLRDGLATR